MDNSVIISYVKEITIAKLTNSTVKVNKDGGKDVSDFMEEIYNKLIELDKKKEN